MPKKRMQVTNISSNVNNPLKNLMGKKQLISAEQWGQAVPESSLFGQAIFQQSENKKGKRGPALYYKLLRLPINGYGEKLIINFLNIAT